MPSNMRAVRFVRGLNSGDELLMFIRLFFWAAYFRVMKRFLPLPGLVCQAVPAAKSHRLGVDPHRVAALGTLAARAIRAGGNANCLERSLTIYRQLIRTGGKPA